MTDVWALVHAERAALIDDLSDLNDEKWEHPSLCDGWRVHDVAAHLVDNARSASLAGILVAMARAHFDFDRMNAQGVARERGATPAETLGRLREVRTLTRTPPMSLDSRLLEEVVHGEDVRRPLGIERSYPSEAVLPALALQARTSGKVGGGKQHVTGLRLQATDHEVSLGEGPEVRGPALSLLLAISGRASSLTDLEGPGVPTLAGRLVSGR
jgi:uncharacterized protein (TIGR03083 family)